MNEIITKILNKRGLVTEEDIQEFLSPSPQKTYDPFLLLGMREGVDLILDAVDHNRHITIYGDYDADGITATVIMIKVIEALGGKVDFYIPSRFTEGYGLNIFALDKLKEQGTELVVTVDCGSVSFDEVEHAKKIGLDILVTDHHNCDNGVVDTIVINPHQPGCPYPFKDLAGCGVAYKLALALRDTRNISKIITNNLLDFVTIGTIADVVPFMDENRTLVKYGLRMINNKCRIGLYKLFQLLGIDQREIKTSDIAYIIAPKINAAGRVKNAGDAAKLLLCEREEEALPLARKLIDYNEERKALQSESEEACLKLRDKYIDGYGFILIESNDSHEGINGIVAGKLKDKFNRPVAIVTPSGDFYKGTSRSVDKLNLYEFLCQFTELFEGFGGHSGACGFTIKKENIGLLRDEANKLINKLISVTPDLMEPSWNWDLEITADDVTEELIEEIEKMEPFGPEKSPNQRPLFLFKNALIKYSNLVGDNKNTLKFTFRSGNANMDAILFSKGQELKDLAAQGNVVNILGTLNLNRWGTRKILQVKVKAIFPL